MAGYRNRHRNAVLHASVVGLAAATAVVWVARPHLPHLQPPALHVRLPSEAHYQPAPGQAPAPGGARSDTPGLVIVASATPTTTPTATPAPTATATSVPTATPPPPSSTPEATPTPDAQSDATEAAPPVVMAVAQPVYRPPAPRSVQAEAAQTAYLRSAPSVDALIVGSLPPGTPVRVLGCAASCTWLLVQLPGGGQAWSESYFYSLLGSLAGL